MSIKSYCASLTLLSIVALISFQSSATAQPPVPTPADPSSQADVNGIREPEVLEAGPLHEAFASPLALEQQSIVVDQQPPAPINELPPDERPEGANVNWLPGYWSFDTERNDFIWVSGLWRKTPPNRTWVPGQWQQIEEGYLWSAGYWAEAQLEQQSMLPLPPASQEQGPSSPAPGDNYLWAPGCWQWTDNNYAWQTGFWYAAQPNWVWVPNHYNYTQSGAVYVRGYWDYPLARRGLLYAPVSWSSGYRFGTSYAYRPRTIVNTGLLLANLFVDHHRGRYYYGRHWGPGHNRPHWLSPWGNNAYSQWGRYNGRSKIYDPLWSHFRWDGHNRRGYNNFDRKDLDKYARNRNLNKSEDLFRKVSRLSDAERKAFKLQRNGASEQANFRKQAEKYRHFDRYAGNRDQRGTHDRRRDRDPSGDRAQRGVNATAQRGLKRTAQDIAEIHIPQFNKDRTANKSGSTTAKTSTETHIRRSVGSAKGQADGRTRVRQGNIDSRLRGAPATRAIVRERGEQSPRIEAVQRSQSSPRIDLRQRSVQSPRNDARQRGDQSIRRTPQTNPSTLTQSRTSPQQSNLQRRVNGNQSFQRFINPQGNNRIGTSPLTTRGRTDVRRQTQQQAAKPITSSRQGTPSSRRINSTRTRQSVPSVRQQATNRVRQALPQTRRSSGGNGNLRRRGR